MSIHIVPRHCKHLDMTKASQENNKTKASLIVTAKQFLSDM
jgi:hypothetical protein